MYRAFVKLEKLFLSSTTVLEKKLRLTTPNIERNLDGYNIIHLSRRNFQYLRLQSNMLRILSELQ